MRKVYSHSKRTTLGKCALQYFFEYYAQSIELPSGAKQLTMLFSPEPGHRVITAEQIAQAAKLKELSNAFQTAGLILHQLIGQHWEHPDWDNGWFIRQAAERYDRIASGEGNGDSRFVLLEMDYDLDDADETIAEARSRLLRAITNYFEAHEIVQLVRDFLDADETLTEQSIGGLPRIRDYTVMGKIDATCRSSDQVRIVDWKMGNSTGDEESLQLTLYGWWAVERFRVPAEQVSVRRVFLGDGVIERQTVMSEPQLDRGRARLHQDVERMQDFHEYGVKGHWEAFPACEKEKVCHQCKYQGVCPAVACAIG